MVSPLLSSLRAFGVFSFFAVLCRAGNACQPYTWDAEGDLSDQSDNQSNEDAATASDSFWFTSPKPRFVQAGEINCRYWGATPEEVNYNSCKELAEFYHATVDKFFLLNPDVDRDCGNIKPRTWYCVSGFIEPLRAYDGRCGRPHNEATCVGTDKPCCNSETWTCGDSNYDCSPGVCYEGICKGDKVVSVDGVCGPQHGDRICVGKWGDCCHRDGQCGTGEEFCARKVCRTGMCLVD